MVTFNLFTDEVRAQKEWEGEFALLPVSLKFQ